MIVGWPDGQRRPHAAVCIICGKVTALTELTAGSCYADGQQAFGCNAHRIGQRVWIVAWAEFNAAQWPVDEERRLRPDLATV